MQQDYRKLAADLVDSLGLQRPPLAIAVAVQKLKITRAIDATFARYAADDAARF